MTLYIASGASIFCGTDRGQTWLQRTAIGPDPLTRVTRLIIDPTDPKTLYASAITSASAEQPTESCVRIVSNRKMPPQAQHQESE
jgi:hypothetical protein